MIAIKELLKQNHLRVKKYQKKDNIVILDTDNGKYIVLKKNNNEKIFNYLKSRNFNYYPPVISSDKEYEIRKYIVDNNIPKEKKMVDLISLLTLLHNKTTYYKVIDESDYKKIYEDFINNINYLTEYYGDIINSIDSKIYPSPWEYVFAINISIIFDRLKYCKEEINNWYGNIKDDHKMRVTVVHNNLNLDNFLQDNNNYFINWEKSKIDIPIFDLYKIYNYHANDFDFSEIFKQYQKDYPLKDEELQLLLIMINLPSKIDLNDSNYNICLSIYKEISRLKSSCQLIKKMKK